MLWWMSVFGFGLHQLHRFFSSSLTSNKFIGNANALIADIHFIFNQNSVLNTEWRLKFKWMHIEVYWISYTEYFIWWRSLQFLFFRSNVDKKWKIELITTTTTTTWMIFESVESKHTQTLRALLTIRSESIQQTASAAREWEKINAKNIRHIWLFWLIKMDGWMNWVKSYWNRSIEHWSVYCMMLMNTLNTASIEIELFFFHYSTILLTNEK